MFRRKSETKMDKIPTIYLCLHGLACAVKFKWTCKNFILFFVSTFFMVINEVNKLYCIFSRFVDIDYSHRKRNENLLTIIMILEFLLRILFFLKKNKLNLIIHRMVKIFSALAPHKISKYRDILILMLIINDIYIIVTVFSFYLSLDPPHIFPYLGNNFNYRYISAPASTPLFYLSVFIQTWGFVNPFIPIYFCCFCLVLMQIIHGFKDKLQKVKDSDYNSLDQICTEVLKLTSDINAAFHDILLVEFIILLGSVLNNTYTILIKNTSIEWILVERISNTVVYFARFVMICVFASSASKAGLELKNSIISRVAQTHERWKSLLLVIKINGSFVEFKLLDSLVLDKNLVLAAVGSIVTYGIIIATFNIRKM